MYIATITMNRQRFFKVNKKQQTVKYGSGRKALLRHHLPCHKIRPKKAWDYFL